MRTEAVIIPAFLKNAYLKTVVQPATADLA